MDKRNLKAQGSIEFMLLTAFLVFVFIIIFPYFEDWDNYEFIQEHNIIQNMFRENDIIFLDLYPLYKHKSAKDHIIENKNFGYDSHPNKEANKIAAEEIYNFLTNNKIIER